MRRDQTSGSNVWIRYIRIKLYATQSSIDKKEIIMKIKVLILVLGLTIPVTGYAQMGMGSHGFLKLESGKLDPGVAAGLSIQPMPVALGQFYTGDWQRGIIYTSLEVAIAIPGMILLSGRGHHTWQDEQNEWTDSEKREFIYLLSGYFLIKTISAFDAGYSAERHNAKLQVEPGIDQLGNLNLNLNYLF